MSTASDAAQYAQVEPIKLNQNPFDQTDKMFPMVTAAIAKQKSDELKQKSVAAKFKPFDIIRDLQTEDMAEVNSHVATANSYLTEAAKAAMAGDDITASEAKKKADDEFLMANTKATASTVTKQALAKATNEFIANRDKYDEDVFTKGMDAIHDKSLTTLERAHKIQELPFLKEKAKVFDASAFFKKKADAVGTFDETRMYVKDDGTTEKGSERKLKSMAVQIQDAVADPSATAFMKTQFEGYSPEKQQEITDQAQAEGLKLYEYLAKQNIENAADTKSSTTIGNLAALNTERRSELTQTNTGYTSNGIEVTNPIVVTKDIFTTRANDRNEANRRYNEINKPSVPLKTDYTREELETMTGKSGLVDAQYASIKTIKPNTPVRQIELPIPTSGGRRVNTPALVTGFLKTGDKIEVEFTDLGDGGKTKTVVVDEQMWPDLTKTGFDVKTWAKKVGWLKGGETKPLPTKTKGAVGRIDETGLTGLELVKARKHNKQLNGGAR